MRLVSLRCEISGRAPDLSSELAQGFLGVASVGKAKTSHRGRLTINKCTTFCNQIWLGFSCKNCVIPAELCVGNSTKQALPGTSSDRPSASNDIIGTKPFRQPLSRYVRESIRLRALMHSSRLLWTSTVEGCLFKDFPDLMVRGKCTGFDAVHNTTENEKPEGGLNVPIMTLCGIEKAHLCNMILAHLIASFSCADSGQPGVSGVSTSSLRKAQCLKRKLGRNKELPAHTRQGPEHRCEDKNIGTMKKEKCYNEISKERKS
ncbi:hypothetical protein CROQUDRAFT_132148 [Cronartium quercuum f. sp. fusiforme G11]|uniref:Uncharacterized protein n=1 Tax=Cronartium quercuum f. sp. fusiforme G11 TaxID=708437 RepID=A0A9P6TEQ2_9BASI|nr:hypothetical protein CROQUDRAFT_132148 [Cronartium quercuum f. sp. fusiforme G11]